LTEDIFKKPKLGEKLMEGITASPGVAMGKVCIHKDIFSHVPTYTIKDHQIGTEIQRLKKAIEEVDFVSIGTNDLVQFTLAVDRDNDLVSHLYQPLDPSILWLIKNVVDAGNAYGKSVSICGEIAGDPDCFPLLFGLGLREFSVAPVAILEIKEISRLVTKEQASLIANKALGMDSSKEIERLLTTHYPLKHS
jgi:phosphoenolpyruvate-protein kinase (PTS system EI component)